MQPTGLTVPADKQKEIVGKLGERILAALQDIADAAQRAASNRTGTGLSLANPSNRMVGDAKAEKLHHASMSEERTSLNRLMLEPFVARVEVAWKGEGKQPYKTYYFPRRSAAGLLNAARDGVVISAGAALGHLAEYEAGETAYICHGGREREARILSRVVLSPTREAGQWDALVRDLEVLPWRDVLKVLQNESLRRALAAIRAERAAPAEIEDILGELMRRAAEAASAHERTRRKVVDRIALRDQPILDRYQGGIFRLPLNRQVLLFGPPGSGKTTTLIKRLAQKLTPDAVSEAEQQLITEYVRDGRVRADSWAMFSPAELLKQYLGDAFNKEGVPDAGNVRSWESERHDLARNTLQILRSGNTGRFRLEANATLLKDRSSPGISRLYEEFAKHVEEAAMKRCNDALVALLAAPDGEVRRHVLAFQQRLGNRTQVTFADIVSVIGETEGLQAEITRLTQQINAELRKVGNVLLNTHKTLHDDLVAELTSLRGEEIDDDEEEVDEEDDDAGLAAAGVRNARVEALRVLMTSLRHWASAVAEGRALGGLSARVIDFIKDKLPPDAQFEAIGSNIGLRARLRTLVRASGYIVLGAPRLYAGFRRQAMREARHFLNDKATQVFVSQNRISRDEVDILLLVMLRNSRRILQASGGRNLDVPAGYGWLETIKTRYLMQVFVDEATDLSAVQLACTMELADPRLRSWFACGDLRQRITAQGIQDEAEIKWLNQLEGVTIDIRRVDIGYRQSRRLRELSDALAALLDSRTKVVTKPPRGDKEADVWPQLGERLEGNALARWLADRIHEVERGIGRLPSIAVFVDGDDRIDPLVHASAEMLAERNIPVVGCKEGRIVGDAREVRVFDIQHIKGLEFEAVFFIGVDALADRIPDLFQRFLYVGVTRAATYLGVTCEATLPRVIEPLRVHFATGGWAGD
jgi:hypothetical protein